MAGGVGADPGGSDRLDSLGMFDVAAAFPEQVADAVAVGEAVGPLPEHDDVANVLVLGMGGSGIAGDLLAAVAGPFMPVPVVVHKGYEPPSFVDRSTLVIAVSFSGNTEETLEAVQEAAGGRRPGARRRARWRAGPAGGRVGRAVRAAARRHPHAARRARRAVHPAAHRARAHRPLPRRHRLGAPGRRAVAAPA